MTWRNRFRMFFGLIFVVALVAALTLVMSQRKGETTSESASVVAEAYPVGTDNEANSSRRIAHSPASGCTKPASSG